MLRCQLLHNGWHQTQPHALLDKLPATNRLVTLKGCKKHHGVNIPLEMLVSLPELNIFECAVSMVQLISQTAIQEFKVGSAERGRSMFESCLRNYPARLDVWSQYLDQACASPPSPPPSPFPPNPPGLLLHSLLPPLLLAVLIHL